MIIKKLRAESFRNIKSAEIEFSPGVNLLLGKNAQGKTNIIECIYMFSRGKSFRHTDDKNLVRFGDEGFRIGIEYENKKGTGTLEYALFGKERKRLKNGYKTEKVAEMLGSFSAVLFYPDDLLLVKGGPEERRLFLNVAISQCHPSYVGIYADYKRALENRNCILKNASKGFYIDESELDAWSELMARYAADIYKERREYIKKLEVYAAEVIADISSGKEKINISYQSDIPDMEEGEELSRDDAERLYKSILKERINDERKAGTSLFGPHRDDMEIEINGVSARSYASQGQQRSIVLALKLAEGEVCRSILGEYPVFLLDDVLSELDEQRQSYIMSGLSGRQIIITACSDDTGMIKADKTIEVRDGEYI